MNESIQERILCESSPLEPVPTSAEPKLDRLEGVRAVLFDIYGTLLISGCGDIGTTQTMTRDLQNQAFVRALAENGIKVQSNIDEPARFLFDEIAADQQRSRAAGVENPEVDIVKIWSQVYERLSRSGRAESVNDESELDFQRIALAYELRTNPVWPMPHARECLVELGQMGMHLGVISNAQFLTIELWKTLLQADSAAFKIDEELQFYSFQHGYAKPGMKLFKLAAAALNERGIPPNEVLYIGNDMLNDMLPAQTIGFRTCLFAGDSRSLRTREGDPQVANTRPDIVITDLSDLSRCIELNHGE